MAITDALSVALKMIGVAADIYAGLFDGFNYTDEKKAPQKTTPEKPVPEKIPDVRDIGIDMDWLKESCVKLKWKEPTTKSFICSKFNVRNKGAIEDIISSLSQEQKQEFTKELTKELNKLDW